MQKQLSHGRVKSIVKLTKCKDCPLRDINAFRDFDQKELEFVSRFKTGELNVDPGATIFVESMHSAHLFTVLDGWAFRYKMLEDGRRQIMNYVLPGDLVGLQGSVMGEMQHSVEALSAVKLCVFERARLNEIFVNHPSLAFDLTWIASREERILDENLLSIGRRSALERAAYLLAFLHVRAKASGLAPTNRHLIVPITQQHVADTLGLSIVHTNKTLKKLSNRELIRWHDRSCEIVDAQALRDVAGWTQKPEEKRPFI
jgi:CRP/FNR family transcriptional regulator, anaerobic regulatory protein